MKKAPLFILLKSLRQLSGRNLLRLLGKGFAHPLFTILTFWATLKAYSIAEQHFPDSHSSHGEGNAFRHALWNCFILMYCCKISSPKKSLRWTEEITNLHEEVFVNPPLYRKMDLHNNRVGRDYFMSLLPTIHRQFFETQFFVDKLLELTHNMPKLEHEGQEFGNQLVKAE